MFTTIHFLGFRGRDHAASGTHYVAQLLNGGIVCHETFEIFERKRGGLQDVLDEFVDGEISEQPRGEAAQ